MKSIFSIIAISILASITFSACKKNDNSEQKTIMGGTVVNFPSRQPLAGIKVYLVLQGGVILEPDYHPHWLIMQTDTLIQSPKHRIDSTLSDINGKFSFAFTPGDCQGSPCPGGIYYTTVLDPNYVIVTPYSSLYSTSDTIFIDHPSYFKLNMHKIAPANISDTVFENRYFIPNNLAFFQGTYHRKAQIGQVNTTIIDTFSYNASSKVILEWRHYKNGLQSTSIDTINLIPNGTTVWNVNY